MLRHRDFASSLRKPLLFTRPERPTPRGKQRVSILPLFSGYYHSVTAEKSVEIRAESDRLLVSPSEGWIEGTLSPQEID